MRAMTTLAFNDNRSSRKRQRRDDEVELYAACLESWAADHLGEADAAVFARTLSGQVRRMWGGIKTFVVGPASGTTPRFVTEVEVWARECLAAMGKHDTTLEGLVALVKRKTWDLWAGQELYFQKMEPGLKRRIYEDSRSMDMVDLARKYDYTTPRLYTIIKEELQKGRARATF
jgi:Mor family transcriptional regulator